MDILNSLLEGFSDLNWQQCILIALVVFVCLAVPIETLLDSYRHNSYRQPPNFSKE